VIPSSQVKEARMRPLKKKPIGSGDLSRSRLDQIIDMRHELVQLADEIDWAWIDEQLADLHHDDGRPAVPTRFMVGLLFLKHIHRLSEERMCERWVHDPYFQYFTGESFFQHDLPHERSGMSHWRKRIGERLGRLAREYGVPLRQSYARVAKQAAMMAGRYAHAKQFKRYNRKLKFLRTRLGRLVRDIGRKTEGDAALEAAFAIPLSRASQIRSQKQRQRGWKLYSWHAPETECIGKGKVHKPYEFGCKVSITTNRRCKGGQFVLHAKAFHGNPYDGHTLETVIAETQALTGREIERVYVVDREESRLGWDWV